MRIKANGIQINYDLTGIEKAPVVMLSHALGSNLAMWDLQLAVLEPYYCVLRYDTRGHGGSDAPPGPYTLKELGADAFGLMDALDMEWVHWVGLSMGGMIGQYLGLNHPDTLRSLSLCDTTAIFTEKAQEARQTRIRIARDKGMQALVESTLERWFTPAYLRQNPPEVEAIRQHFLATPVAGFIECSEAIQDLNYLEQLIQIRTPSLIVVGEDDPGTPVTASQAIHERIPDSKLVVLAEAAHLSNIEQPEAFNTALLGFLREH